MSQPPPTMSPPSENRTAADELDNPRSLAIFIVIIVFTITSTISIILRLVAKRMSQAKLVVEDYVILVAQVLVYGMGTAAMLEIFLGSAGHHAYEVPESHVVNFLKILVAMQTFYGSTLGLIKTSICLFYIRIFFVKSFRIATWIVIGFIVSWGIMVILTGLLMCRPFAFNWDQTIPGGECADQKSTFLAVGVLDLVTDLCVFILPLPMIWNLKVTKGNKVALFGIFGLGLTTMVISCVRIEALMATDFTDVTFSSAYPLLWSFLEPAVGITVACGPVLGPLVRKFRYFRTQNTMRRLYASQDTGAFGRLTDSYGDSELDHKLGQYPATVTTVSRGVPSSPNPRSTMGAAIGVKHEWETRVQETR